MKTVMKKSRESFEDFLKQLSEVRLKLEVDRYVLGASREKLCPPASEGSRSKSSKKHHGGTGSGLLFDLKGCTEKVSNRVQTKKNSAYG